MSGIPPELRELWSQRDRTAPKTTASGFDDDETVLMEFRDDFAPAPPPPPRPAPKPEPLLTESEPVRDVKLFPTYKIAPSPINLATFDVKRKRE